MLHPAGPRARAVVFSLAVLAFVAALQLVAFRADLSPAGYLFTPAPRSTLATFHFIMLSMGVFLAMQRVPAPSFAWFLFALGVLVAGIGLLQRGFGNSHYYGLLAVRHGDPFGPYTNPNQAAVLMEFSLFAGISVAASWGRFIWTSRGAYPDRIAQASMLLLGLAILVGGLLTTGSRGALASIAVAGGVAAAAVTARTPLRAFCVSFGWVAIFSIGAIALLKSGAVHGDISTDFRLRVYPLCLAMALDFPIFGVGAGAFLEAFKSYVPREITWGIVDHAHSDWLQLPAEYGLIAAPVFMSTVFYVVVSTWRSVLSLPRSSERLVRGGLFAGALSALLHSALDFPFRNPSLALLFLAVVAVLCAPEDGRAGRPLARPVAFILATALGAFPAIAYLSSRVWAAGVPR